MKKLHLLLIAISILILYSCERSEAQDKSILPENTAGTKEPADDSVYYDNDADCDQNTQAGNCCDVDGRILVVPNQTYTYTYDGYNSYNNGNTVLTTIEWEVVSGSITIISGQNTPEVKLKFESDFTEGSISAMGFVNGLACQNILNISKL